MPRESLDAPEDLPKESRSQVALGRLEDEVPSMPDQAAAGLEQSKSNTAAVRIVNINTLRQRSSPSWPPAP
jgi:hypothetical protein